jgi:hypothetical protein
VVADVGRRDAQDHRLLGGGEGRGRKVRHQGAFSRSASQSEFAGGAASGTRIGFQPARGETMTMNEKLLTTWSEEYVSALFRSVRAHDPRGGRFRHKFERDAFIEAMTTRRADGVEVEPLVDGLGIRITGAGPEDLLNIVKLAQSCGGEIFFPGTLPG